MFIKLIGILAFMMLVIIGPQVSKAEKIIPAQTQIQIPKTVEPEAEIEKADVVTPDPAPIAKKEVIKSSAPVPSNVTPSKPKAVIEKAKEINTPIPAPKVETPKLEIPKIEVPKAEAPKVEEPKVEAPAQPTKLLPPNYQTLA